MKKGMLAIIMLVVVGVIGMMLYKSATSDDLPDDEWFEFEVPEEDV